MKNKKIWKLLAIHLLLIISCISIICNAIFIPKYYNLKKDNEISLKVQINAIDDRTKKTLFSLNYITTIINLGQLMAQYEDTYILKNYSFGRIIEGIKYVDENKEEKHELKNNELYYWIIYYNNNPANIGIDIINLNTNDVIDLHYQKSKLI